MGHNFTINYKHINFSIGCAEVVSKTDETQVTVRDKEAFTFNHVFSQMDSQEQVYCEAVEPMIENLFEGYNITILAYGQTGSGIYLFISILSGLCV